MELFKSSAQSIRKEPRLNRRFSRVLQAIAMLGLGLACNVGNINTNTPRAQTPRPTPTITPDYRATAEVNIDARATQIVEAATAQSSMRPDIISRVPEVCRSSGVALRVLGKSDDGLRYRNGGSGSLVFRKQSARRDSETYFFLTAYHTISSPILSPLTGKFSISSMTVSGWDQSNNARPDVSLTFLRLYRLLDENGRETGLAVVVGKSKSGGKFLPESVEPIGLSNLKGWKSDSWKRIFVAHNPRGADVEAMVFTEVDARSVVDVADKSGNVKVEVQPLPQKGNPTATYGSSGAQVCVTSKNNLAGAQVGVVQKADNLKNSFSFEFEPLPDGIANQLQAIVEAERVR